MTQDAWKKHFLLSPTLNFYVYCNISASSGPNLTMFFSNSIYIKFAKRTCKPHLSMTFHFSAIACERYLLTGGLHKKLLKTGFSDLLA